MPVDSLGQGDMEDGVGLERGRNQGAACSRIWKWLHLQSGASALVSRT